MTVDILKAKGETYGSKNNGCIAKNHLILDENYAGAKEVFAQMTFTGCRVIRETDLEVVNRSWEVDLEEF